MAIENYKVVLLATFWLKNIHRWKDAGIIIEKLNQKFGCDTYILTAKKDDLYIGRSSKIIELKNVFWGFFKHISLVRPNLLILFHLTRWTLIYTIISKLINPFGKIYIKSDIWLSTTMSPFYGKERLSWQFLLLVRFLLLFAEISVENKDDYNSLRKVWCNILHVPNWIDISNLNGETKMEEKENIILTVWRLGSVQKNNKNFLEISKQVLKKDSSYKAILVGEIEDETNFRKELKHFLDENTEIKDRITLTWYLAQEEVFELYRKAKFLVMTSLREGFSSVFAEAAYFWTIIISTDVWGVRDITDNGKYWYIYNNKNQVLPFIENHNVDIYWLRRHIIINYDWDVIVEKLYQKLL